MRSIGLKIFWKLIAVGLYGDGGTPAELARQEVLDFLNLCLTQEGPQTPSSIMAAEPAGYVLMKATATISIARNATKAKTFSKMFFITDPS